MNVQFLFLYILPWSLADCWQTQSLCYHKELMKRTLGKPTHAFEARDYVVSLPMLQVCSHSQTTNPRDSAKTGDTGAAVTLPSHWSKFSTERAAPWGKDGGSSGINPTAILSQTCIERPSPPNRRPMPLDVHWMSSLSECPFQEPATVMWNVRGVPVYEFMAEIYS